MKKFIGILVLATFLLSGIAMAEEVAYTYKWNDRFKDHVDLLIAKLTPKKAIEKQLKVYDRIMERRAKHIESHPDDLTEIQKLKEDVVKVDDLGAPTATFEKHLETLEAVKAKLEAKNITTTGIQNAIDNANELLEKKGLGNTNKNQNSGTVFGTQKK